MACPINPEEVSKLKMFIQLASAQPQLLNMPQLEFFKKFVEQLGGKVPEGGNFEHSRLDILNSLINIIHRNIKPQSTFSAKAEAKAETFSAPPPPQPEEPKEESDPESDIELDLLDTVLAPDTDPSQEMGDDSKEATEDETDQASDLRGKAAKAYSEGDFEGRNDKVAKQSFYWLVNIIVDAVNFYTEAILLNPHALFYAKRGQAFLKLKKPNAAIRDCERALKLNPDSASAYKFRGRAHRLLGNWEESAKDLRQACKLDFDEEADEWLKEVTPNAKKIEQHQIKQERKKAEKEMNDRKERVRRAQEANKKAAEENKKQAEDDDGGDFGMGGGLPPDFMEAFGDPEVAAALQDVMTNPGNIMKWVLTSKCINSFILIVAISLKVPEQSQSNELAEEIRRHGRRRRRFPWHGRRR